jgi:phosphohistidine phosphatase
MKKLMIMRHAKSSWSHQGLIDKDRPLNARGQDAARKIGQWMATANLVPDQVISSTAQRCRQTWQGVASRLSNDIAVRFEDRLYMAGAGEMLKILQSASGDTVLMLGHMPGISAFASGLRRDPPPMHETFQKYPTGAVTVLEFRVDDWQDAQNNLGIFVAYKSPRDLD